MTAFTNHPAKFQNHFTEQREERRAGSAVSKENFVQTFEQKGGFIL